MNLVCSAHEAASGVLEPIRAFFKKHGIKADFIGQPGSAADVIAKLCRQRWIRSARDGLGRPRVSALPMR